MKKITVFLLLLVLTLSLTACGNNDVKQEPQENVEETDVFEIETDAGSIHYPAKWKGQVRTESTENGIRFFGNVDGREEQLLFTLEFGESEGTLIGQLNGQNVYVVDAKPEFDDSWTDAEKAIISSMQEDVNEIIDCDLKKEADDSEYEDVYLVDSAIGKLEYPKKWKDNVRTENTEKGIAFYGTVEGKGEQLMFTLEFGESDGCKLCSLDGTDVFVVENRLSFDGTWSSEQQRELADMQDAVNTILEGLAKLDGYVPA